VKAWRLSHRWHPNQLRHSFGTVVREKFGLEVAQTLLGHAKADITQVYAERLRRAAEEAVRAMGYGYRATDCYALERLLPRPQAGR
jgi:site-specific recombinase XerD